MRILHISTRLIIGGSQENTILSCEGQARAGHDVHLAHGPIYGPEGSMLPRVEAFRTPDDQTITTHEVTDLIRELDRKRDCACLGQLRRLIRGIDPDVIHTHSSKAGILGRLAGWKEGGRRGRRAVIHTVHGPPFHRYESMKRNALYIIAERIAAKRCHRIITVCDTMKTQFLANRIGRPRQYETVYSGADLTPYVEAPGDDARRAARRQLGLPHNAVIIGTVARLADLKGHDDIIKALAEDMRAHPHWRLLWVGDGWKREELEHQARNEGLLDRIIITGMIAPEDVPLRLRAMDVLVHPSYREGLPRAVVQGLLTGLPTVAYDVDGAPEAILDPVTGRLVTAGDLKSLRATIVAMIEKPEKAHAAALKGREDCLERFSDQRMVDELLRIYNDVLKERRPGSVAA